jgi:DNA polymerase V
VCKFSVSYNCAMEAAHGGLFGISEDHIEKYQSLDVRFIKNKAATFFFQAEGDSMSPLILPKDVLVVDRSITPSNKHIVIVSVNNEMLCKRLIFRAGQMFLSSENLKYPEIHVVPELEVSIFGVVRSSVREHI